MTAAPYLLPAPEPETWLSREQVLDLTSWSTEWLRRQVNGNVIVSRLTSFPSRNGKPERIYLLSSLPEDAQAKHSRPTLQIAPKAQVVTLTGPLFVGVAPESPRAQLTDPDDIAQADERYAILKPLLKFKDDPSRFLSIRLDDGSRITSEARLIQWLSNQQDVSPKTLKRYKQRYLEGGWAALADRKRSDSGESRWFNRYPEAKLLAAYVYLEQRQSVTVAWEAIKRDHTWLGIPADDLPSYETVRAALQTVTPTLRILAREGAVKYREMCAVYLSRAYSEYSNQIWVSDHAIIDVELFNDCFPEQPYGTPIRLRFTCLLDFRARFVVGYSWAWEGSSRSIATAMRHAISAYGPPEEFYCDNGADFRKVAKGAMPAYLRETALTPEGWYDRELQELDKLGLMARCGIAVRHCLVRHPQSKHVERFFRTMHETFDKKWPTYTGGRPDRRPDLTEAAMASHRKLMRHGQVERSRHPRASLFMSCFEAWLDEYHHKLHRGRGMDGRCPADVYEQERNPHQRPVPEPHLLAMMLAEREVRTVQEGSVTIAKRRFVGYDAESYDRMHRRNRTEVLVAYDPNDMDAVAVLDQDGVFLTWARAEEFTTQSNTESGAAIAASMQARRHLEKQDRQTLRGITLAARQIGARSEVEHLAEKAVLTPALADRLTHRPFTASAPEVADTTKLHSGDIADRLAERIRRNQQ